MGGDQGPKATLEGVAMASKIYPDVKFKLFGDMTKSQPQLKKNRFANYEFIHTEECIKSDDEPVTALRKLKKSSMRLGINNLSNSESHGFVSAGNTGALMAISKFVLKTLNGNKPSCNSWFDAYYERSNSDIRPRCQR